VHGTRQLRQNIGMMFHFTAVRFLFPQQLFR